MSKFEPKSTEHCCKNCKWLNSDYVVATFPAQARCEKFEVLVSLDRTTCIEDEEGWKPEKFAEKLREFTKGAIYRGVRGGGGYGVMTESVVDVKEPTPEERVKKIEERVEALEKAVAQLNDTFHICATNETHNYENLRKRLEALETQTKHFGYYLPKVDYQLKGTAEGKTCEDESNGRQKVKCPANCGWEVYEYKGNKPIKYCPNCGARIKEEK